MTNDELTSAIRILSESSCPGCGMEFDEEYFQLRKELLGVVTCAKCTPQKKKPRGYPEYGSPGNPHQGGEGVLHIVDN